MFEIIVFFQRHIPEQQHIAGDINNMFSSCASVDLLQLLWVTCKYVYLCICGVSSTERRHCLSRAATILSGSVTVCLRDTYFYTCLCWFLNHPLLLSSTQQHWLACFIEWVPDAWISVLETAQCITFIHKWHHFTSAGLTSPALGNTAVVVEVLTPSIYSMEWSHNWIFLPSCGY